MLETSNKVDEGKVTKERNISLSKDTTASSPSGIVETSYKHDISLMIEAEETIQNKSTGNLKDDTLFYWIMTYNLRMMNWLKKIRWMGNMKNLSFNMIKGVVWLK